MFALSSNSAASIFEVTSLPVLLAALGFVIGLLLFLIVSDWFRKFAIKHIGTAVLLIFCAGFILYFTGFYYGASTNIVSASLRAFLASLEMFASRSELIEVSEHLKEDNVPYMLCFSIVHFLAFLVSLLVILDIFGKKLVSRMELDGLRARNRKGVKKLYVFDGTDSTAVTLANSLPEDEAGRVILFVKGNVDTDVKKFSVTNLLVSGFSQRRNDIKVKDSRVVYTSLPLSAAMTDKSGWLYRVMIRLTRRFRATEFFFLSGDSTKNANAAYSVGQDKVELGLNIKIFAGVNTHSPYTYKLAEMAAEGTVVMVNSSALKIEHLFGNAPHFESGNNTGKVALIYGFGHTGIKCFTRLSQCGYDKIEVVSPTLNKYIHDFLGFHPEYDGDQRFSFTNADSHSEAFWKILAGNIEKITDVVITVNDDDEVLKVMIKVMDYAAEHRKTISNFHIYALLAETSAAQIDNLARVKWGWAPGTIVAFGDLKNVYNYSYFTTGN